MIVTVNGVYREDLSNFTNRDIEVSNLNNHGAKTLKEKEPNNLGDQYLRSLNTLLIDNAFLLKLQNQKELLNHYKFCIFQIKILLISFAL